MLSPLLPVLTLLSVSEQRAHSPSLFPSSDALLTPDSDARRPEAVLHAHTIVGDLSARPGGSGREGHLYLSAVEGLLIKNSMSL